MATTFKSLVDQVLMKFHGFTSAQDQATYLTADVSSSALVLPVYDATAISRGIIEIGDELIWVDSVDRSTGAATIPPYGRGYNNTTPAAHVSGTRVTSSPIMPRATVKDHINDTIHSLSPDIYGVASTTITYNPAVSTYALPAGTTRILSIEANTLGVSHEWLPLRFYTIDRSANTTTWPTGVTLTLRDNPHAGATINVTYAKDPTALTDETDVFTTTTGLPASCAELVVLGACYRMAPFVDVAHLQGFSAEAQYGTLSRPQAGGISLARYLQQSYQVRLQDEIKGFQAAYPLRSHYTV